MRNRAGLVVVVMGLAVLLGLAGASANGGPIAGVVKSVDAAAGTLVVETTNRGQVRQVVVHLRPDSQIVRFVRPTEPGKSGFVEQKATLTDLKPGWTVSVKARHDGDKEIAEIVRVVHEK